MSIASQICQEFRALGFDPVVSEVDSYNTRICIGNLDCHLDLVQDGISFFFKGKFVRDLIFGNHAEAETIKSMVMDCVDHCRYA